MKRLILVVLPAACLAGAALVALALPAGRRTTTAAAVADFHAQRVVRVGQLETTADWFDEIFRSLKGDDRERRVKRDLEPEEQDRRGDGGRFRTMCVRLCDGFPIPMSFSAPRSRFAKDARRCAEACPASRLFVYRNPGAELDEMVDLDGRAYQQLSTAFLYQNSYVENCTCQGNPWDPAAIARHTAYAEEAAQLAAEARARSTKPSQRSEGRPSRRSRLVESHIDDTERR